MSSAANLDDLGSTTAAHDTTGSDPNDISQEDKPRSRIVAEYLAHGYIISDNALQRAIQLDNKHGVSSRFTNALTAFDQKYKATDKAKGLDASYGITDKATQGWRGMTSYFEKAMGTPTGRKLASFYTSSDKQVRDIHAEARRLADLKAGKSQSKEESSQGAGNDKKAENEKTKQTLPGSDRTTCGCGGATGDCPCEEGKCACSGCGKGTIQGEKTATGPAGDVAATSGVQPLS